MTAKKISITALKYLPVYKSIGVKKHMDAIITIQNIRPSLNSISSPSPIFMMRVASKSSAHYERRRNPQHKRQYADDYHFAIDLSGNGTLVVGWHDPSSLAYGFVLKSRSSRHPVAPLNVEHFTLMILLRSGLTNSIVAHPSPCGQLGIWLESPRLMISHPRYSTFSCRYRCAL